MTKTDIPPGGEGEISVTFSSGHKKGKQRKTITVESNDRTNPKATLHITAFIEVEFGFAPATLGFGRVDKDETITKRAKILVKNPSRTKLAQLTTSSDFVMARVIDPDDGEASDNSITVEITISPGLPVGRIDQTIIATSTDTSLAETRLRLGGSIIGEVEVSPELINFAVLKNDSSDATPVPRKVSIVNHADDQPLKIIEVHDPDDRLTLELRTLQEGQRFELLVSPKKIESTTRNLVGSIVIKTNNPSQDSLAVRYMISFRK